MVFIVLVSKYFMHWLTTVRRKIVVDSESAMPSATLDSEVAALSPRGSPLVLHDPEVLTSFRAVANRRHCVVVGVLAVGIRCFFAALRVVEDAVAVVKQVVSVNVCGGRSNRGNMCGHVSFSWIPRDVVTADGGSRVVAAVVVVAVVVRRRVRAAVLLLQPASVLAHDRLHVPVRPPAFAAICGEAVDQVLLRQVGDDAGLLGEAGLDGGDGSKGGTAATLLLVLDQGDDPVVPPVPRAWC